MFQKVNGKMKYGTLKARGENNIWISGMNELYYCRNVLRFFILI